nr:corrinoid protein [Candidatus Njordarchaeum guaymaensis]
DGTLNAVQAALDSHVRAYEIVKEGLAKGMEEVGKKYEDGAYFLSELIVSGEIMKDAMAILEPHLKSGEAVSEGTIVIGTVAGDLHDIGKNIVITLLKSAGFKVVDLGVDVPARRFVEEAKMNDAQVVAMSALLTTTMREMKNVIDALEQAGIREKLFVMVGGAALTEEFARKIGADAYGEDAVDAIRICRKMRESKRGR